MPGIPAATQANPIDYHEKKVWIKGIDATGAAINASNLTSPGALLVRNAARPFGVSTVFAGAGAANVCALYTPSPITYGALILVEAGFLLQSVSAACILEVDLRTISTAPTGGTALATVSQRATSNLPASLGMLAQTGGGTEIRQVATLSYNLGITGAASVANPAPVIPWTKFPLVSAPMLPYPSIDVASRGWKITIDSNAAATVIWQAYFLFLEIN